MPESGFPMRIQASEVAFLSVRVREKRKENNAHAFKEKKDYVDKRSLHSPFPAKPMIGFNA